MHYTTFAELHQVEMAIRLSAVSRQQSAVRGMAVSRQQSAIRWIINDFLTMSEYVCSRAMHRTS